MNPPTKPLGIKAYGHIMHLPGSRLGPGDHRCEEGQARICTVKARDRHDTIVVQEKLDGSNVAVARIDGRIVPLTRAGWPAETSAYLQHKWFAGWVYTNWRRFYDVLEDGERLCGEWLAQAHGTRYKLPHEPFVAFDLMREHVRLPFQQLSDRVALGGFVLPMLVSYGPPVSVEAAMEALRVSGHGAIDTVEGAVWRVERMGVVEFLTKYVRPNKVDGCYLPSENGGREPVWNWRPEV